MLRYAIVNDSKMEPFSRGRGVCPACRGDVIAKCGRFKIHHWAHMSTQECDPWAEHIGPWHLSWQNLILPEFVEVPIAPHRADIIGAETTVVELQHSSISGDEIQRREQFYGKMIWVFDATYRFEAIRTGDRCFFSLGKTRHLEACRKPVFLDFGPYLVQVVRMDGLFHGFSGYGIVRDRRWFLDIYLRDQVRPDLNLEAEGQLLENRSTMNEVRRYVTYDETRWLIDGEERVLPAGTPYVSVGYGSVVMAGDSEMANGWKKDDLVEMAQFLRTHPVIFDGRLRVLPCPQESMVAFSFVEDLLDQLQRAQSHVAAGRIPKLPIDFRDTVVRCGREYEATMKPSEVVRIRRAYFERKGWKDGGYPASPF